MGAQAAATEQHLRKLRTMLDAYERFDAQWRLERGLSPTEKLVITHLWACGDAPMGELARHAGLTSGGATSIVARLERDGYLVRRADQLDRRRQIVSLTEKGRTTRAALDATLERAARSDGLDLAAAARYLEALTEQFERGADEIRTQLTGRAQDLETSQAGRAAQQ